MVDLFHIIDCLRVTGLVYLKVIKNERTKENI